MTIRSYISYVSQTISTSGLLAAILDFQFPVASDSNPSNTTDLLDPENGGVAVWISFLSHM